MRKVFALLSGLFLLAMFAACSEDSTPTPPTPSNDLSIVTSALSMGYTCSPYNMMLQAQGGTAPYTWTLAEGSTLPDGMALTADGHLTGLIMNAGDFTFSVRVTDSSNTPKTDEQEYTMNVSAPSNPSLAIFFDTEAAICSSGTTAWTPLNCYVYIMSEGSDLACAQACEFKLRITDNMGVDLDAGSEYAIMNVTVPSYVAATLGDLFSGIALSFSRPEYGPEPIQVASFGLLLLEDLSNLSFKFEANPGGTLGVASCETGYPIVNVTGREAAVNY